jgi:hypothetical protein
MTMPTGPELCECEAQISTASPVIPVVFSICARASSTTCLGTTSVSSPITSGLTSCHRQTAATRTLQASWKLPVVALAVAARLLHADVRRDVPLGEACLDV